MVAMIQKLWSERIVRKVVIALLALLALVSVIQGMKNAVVYSQDFQWDAAKALSLKIDPYDESLSESGRLSEDGIREFYEYYESIDAPQKMEANQFPSLLMLLFPMLLFPAKYARIVWLILNLFFLAGIVFLLRKTFFRDTDIEIFTCLMLLMLAGTPLRNHLGVGQHTIFSLFFFLLAVYLSKKDKRVLGGICLAISYFKYTLTAILALYFIYKKRYKELIISVMIHVVLTAVAAVNLGESFISMIVKPLKVSSALSGEGGLDLGALLSGSKLSFILAFFIMVFLFYVAIKLDDGYDKEFISVLILWSLILLYHRTYDFFVMIIAAALVLTLACPLYLRYLYAISIAGVFFVLRVFSESLISRIAVGALYYCLTIMASIYIARKVFGRGKYRA